MRDLIRHELLYRMSWYVSTKREGAQINGTIMCDTVQSIASSCYFPHAPYKLHTWPQSKYLNILIPTLPTNSIPNRCLITTHTHTSLVILLQVTRCLAPTQAIKRNQSIQSHLSTAAAHIILEVKSQLPEDASIRHMSDTPSHSSMCIAIH